MKKPITPTRPTPKKKIQGNLVRPDEDFHDKISLKEQKRRELARDELLQKLRTTTSKTIGKIVINGQEIDYLDEIGTNGSTWRVYGKGPHFSEGRLIHHSNGTWEVQFNYSKVISERVHSRRNHEKILHYSSEIPMTEGIGIMVMESTGIPFLADLETLNYALCDTGTKYVTRSAIAPARRAITCAIEKAIKECNGDTLRKMAQAMDALVRIRDRKLIHEAFLHSILATSKRLNRIPFKGEVQKHYEDTHDILDASRVSQIFKEIGFEWMPNGKSGPTPKTQGRSVRQAP